MKHSLRKACILTLAALFAAPLAASAQTPFAGDNFDDGVGFDPLTRVVTPDNSGNLPRGTFEGLVDGMLENTGLFDRFGIVSTADNLPFDLVDASLGTVPDDTSGFVPESKTDNFVLSVDPNNDVNPGGAVSAEWTFDISGRSGLGLSVDFGMHGDFEAGADFYNFTYSIDGSSPLPAFSITGDNDLTYTITMDNGFEVDRVEDRFFDETDWFDLVDFGPGDYTRTGDDGEFTITLDYLDDDNGLDGDTLADDGQVPVSFDGLVEQIRGYSVVNPFGGPFSNVEFGEAIFDDPLVITTGDGTVSGEIIPADFTTFTTALAGTGSVLTLMLDGESNGGDEFFAFDNIVLSEGNVSTLAGDYNDDGFVDAADYTVWRDGGSPDSSEAGYTLWADNYGAGTPLGSVAIPEPTTVVLALLAAAGLATRRNG